MVDINLMIAQHNDKMYRKEIKHEINMMNIRIDGAKSFLKIINFSIMMGVVVAVGVTILGCLSGIVLMILPAAAGAVLFCNGITERKYKKAEIKEDIRERDKFRLEHILNG